MSRFVFRTDVHIADRAPESRTDDWKATILGKLRQINRIAQDRGADAILDGGDLFYLKSPSRNSHSLMVDLIRVHKEAKIPTFVVPGNHDITHDSLDSLDKQPLQVLAESGAVTLLRAGPGIIHEKAGKISVRAVPYQKRMTLEDLKEALYPPAYPVDKTVAVVHYFASKAGGEFYGTPVFKYYDLISEFPWVDVWCFGHWHMDQGVEEIDGKVFVNLGAVSRGSLRYETMDRIPKVAVLDIKKDGVAVEVVPLEVEPASNIFKVEERQQQQYEDKQIETFVARLKHEATVSTKDDLEGMLKDIDIADDVRSVVLELLRGEAEEAS